MPVAVKVDLWPSVLEDIQKAVGEQRHALWFRNLKPVSIEGDPVVLGAPNLFVRDWLETHFSDLLKQTLARHLGRVPALKFVIDPQLFRETRKAEMAANAEIVEAAAAPDPRKETPRDTATLCREFTLDRFVVGSGNKLAHACAMELIESKSNRLHPLFIHSLSGLGKSHLMQAIYHEVRKRDDGRTAEYLSAESFTNQFLYALRSHRLDAFRNRYRNTDVLLIDDVHFLSNKMGLQEELLHTMEAIDADKRQLVLASDVHPKMLARMKQGLASRFGGGMVVRMTQPDFATRVAILKAKLQQQGRRLPDDVVKYIARGFEGSVRELMGAATMVLAYAGLTGAKIDGALARQALARMEAPGACNGGIDPVERAVARQYGIKVEDLRRRRQSRGTRLARQVCMYLARQCTPMSCREIAQHFGSANHSTVIFAVNRIEAGMRSDRNLAEVVGALKEQVRKG
jgi:chromosomal replication initiator protein